MKYVSEEGRVQDFISGRGLPNYDDLRREPEVSTLSLDTLLKTFLIKK